MVLFGVGFMCVCGGTPYGSLMVVRVHPYMHELPIIYIITHIPPTILMRTHLQMRPPAEEAA